MNDKQPDIFSIWENLKKEKALAAANGISSVKQKEVLLVDGL